MSEGMLGVTLREVRGPLNDLTEKLAGSEGERWLESLKLFLREEDPWRKTEFELWYRLQVGCVTASNFRYRFREAGMRISGVGQRALSKFSPLTGLKNLQLVRFRANSPEFSRLSFAQTFEQIKSWGLQLCPRDVGPKLRLEYKHQPKNEELFIGMEPFGEAVDVPRVFSISHNDSGLWLSADSCVPHFVETAVVPWWVFVLDYD